MLTDIERAAITRLIELARAAWRAAEDSEEFEGPDGRTHAIGSQDFDDLTAALDRLDDQPDDKPGEALGPSGRAEWALRRLLRPDHFVDANKIVYIAWSDDGQHIRFWTSDAARAARYALDIGVDVVPYFPGR